MSFSIQQRLKQSCRILSEYTQTRNKHLQVIASIRLIVQERAKLEITNLFFCILCQSGRSGKSSELQCGHSVHIECIENYLKQTYKRLNLTLEQLYQKDPTSIHCFLCNLHNHIEQKYEIPHKKEALNKLKFQTWTNCAQCKQIFAYDKIITLNCDHRYCLDCLETYFEKHLIDKKYEMACLVCKQRIQEQLIQYVVKGEYYRIFNNLISDNLKTEDQNLIIRNCKGILKSNREKLQDIQNPTKYEALCRYYQNNPDKYTQYIACSAKLSYHKVDDAMHSSIICFCCGLETCVNGCDSVHKGLTCQQFNQQQLIYKSFTDFFKIKPEMMDVRGDRDYVRTVPIKKMINGFQYFLPIGFKQYGINVNKYQDKQWLQKSQNSWVIMYHGVKNASNLVPNTSITVLQNIFDKGLIVGPAQAYAGHICARTGQIIGNGIYGSPHVEVCEKGYANYNTKAAGVDYSLVIKCRVRKQAIRICRKASDLQRKQAQYQNDYWVINNPADVRPYAILLKRKLNG